MLFIIYFGDGEALQDHLPPDMPFAAQQVRHEVGNEPVPYTHLTLPTDLTGTIVGVHEAVERKKK